jgi:hypothetical protein
LNFSKKEFEQNVVPYLKSILGKHNGFRLYRWMSPPSAILMPVLVGRHIIVPVLQQMSDNGRIRNVRFTVPSDSEGDAKRYMEFAVAPSIPWWENASLSLSSTSSSSFEEKRAPASRQRLEASKFIIHYG